MQMVSDDQKAEFFHLSFNYSYNVQRGSQCGKRSADEAKVRGNRLT